jgi:hypothetical protein
VSKGRDDSPPAGNEATSDGNGAAPAKRGARDAASDDLVSVDPQGSVDVGGDDPPAPPGATLRSSRVPALATRCTGC